MRQGQIHVVATQHQVAANPDTGQLGLAIDLLNLDQAQVGRATAHIAHQHQPAGLQLGGQAGLVTQQPVVKDRLRLLQQTQFGQPGIGCCQQRQAARTFVKRGRHREHQVLQIQWAVWKLRVPRRLDVCQVTCAGLHRRHFGHIGVATPGQDRCQTIDGGMRQPALGTGHQTARNLRPQLPRKTPHNHWRRVICTRLGPGQLEFTLGKLSR